MRGDTSTFTVKLVLEECCECHVPFGITSDMRARLENTHGWFYCPNGHSQHYIDKTEA